MAGCKQSGRKPGKQLETSPRPSTQTAIAIEFESTAIGLAVFSKGRMGRPNGQQGDRRAHLLMVYAGGAGHYYLFHHILYLLSSPAYVNKVIVTAVSSQSRVEELAKLKERGDFGSLDLRTEELPMPALGNEAAKVMKEKPGAEYFIQLAENAFESIKAKLSIEKDNVNGFTCILSDMFYTFLLEVAEELKVPWYPLVASATWYTYSCFLVSDPLLCSTDPNVRKGKIPGLEFSRLFDYPPDILSYPQFFVTKCERFERCKAILINQAEEWDAPAGAVTALRDCLRQKKAVNKNTQALQVPKVLLIGPVANIDGFTLSPPPKYADMENPKCFTWLDKQPAKSVLYVAFGTMLNLPEKATFELAHGLVDSGVSFLWVHKIGPSQTMASVLPAGFEDRTRGRGLIEIGFAPQSRILQHPAVGGFLSHCGWNSIMESICAGVPLITWPLSFDQPLNARFLVDVWKAGIGIKNPDEDYRSDVCREEVTTAVKALMNGEQAEEVRKNVHVLKRLAEISLKEGGSSYAALHSFAEEVTNPTKILTAS